MEAIMAQVRGATLERNHIQIDSEALKKQIDDECGPKIAELDQQIAEWVDLLRAWSEANTSEFAGLKSIETPQGLLGFRLGNRTLKPLKGFTWETITEEMQDRPKFIGYLRIKHEVNKQALLVDLDQIPPEELRAVGIKVQQEEIFFVDPKIEELENRKSVTT